MLISENSSEDKKVRWLEHKVKFPKFSEIKEKNTIRCPVYGCFKPFNSVTQLKNHMARNHKELAEFGIEVQSNGKIKYSKEMLNNVMR